MKTKKLERWQEEEKERILKILKARALRTLKIEFAGLIEGAISKAVSKAVVDFNGDDWAYLDGEAYCLTYQNIEKEFREWLYSSTARAGVSKTLREGSSPSTASKTKRVK